MKITRLQESLMMTMYDDYDPLYMSSRSKKQGQIRSNLLKALSALKEKHITKLSDGKWKLTHNGKLIAQALINLKRRGHLKI